jgi:CBS domain-containing protein
MRTVHDILEFKGRRVWSVAPDDKVLDALALMARHEIGAVTVLAGERLVGILTERDYARKVVLLGRSSRESPISDVMTREVICVSPERKIDECMAIITGKRVRHLPVVEQKRLVGLVSIGDLVQATIAEQEQLIEHLQQYIAGY